MSRTKAQIAAELKSPGLAGDQYRSFALGARDPRHRRGPQATSVTGLRYNQTEFEVSRDGRLNLRRKGIDTSKLEDGGAGGGGTVVIPAQTRTMPLEWRTRANDSNNIVDLVTTEDGNMVISRLPEISVTDGTEMVIFWGAIPADGDRAVDWSLQVGVIPGLNVSGAFVFNIEIYSLVAGDDMEGSGGVTAPDVTLAISGTAGGVRGTYDGSFSNTFSASGLNAAAKEMFVRLDGTTLPGQLLITGMWLEYQTEAATITVT